MEKFVPLHIVSGYTFLSSGLSVEKIIKSVYKYNFPGAGLCDFNVLHGVPKFIKGMEQIKKPFVVGSEFIVDGFNISLFCMDEEGYLNLCKLSSLSSYLNIELTHLSNYSKGLWAVIDTSSSIFLNQSNLNDSAFTKKLNNITKIYKSFFLGIDIYSSESKMFASKIREFASNHLYETIAFPKILYENVNHAAIIDICAAIKGNYKIKEDDLTKKGYHCFFKSEEYERLYTPSEVSNTLKFLNSTNFNFHQKRGKMVHFQVDDSYKYLKDLVYEALKKKNIDDDIYIQRLEYELSVISSLGYCDYFLIVSDYVNFAKTNGILVGPGRGSAAGSLVSYLLNITAVDPLKYDLQFERFLNPKRVTMPDIDVDFDSTKRNIVLEYIKTKYSSSNVAYITTYQTILSKQAIRKIGSIFDIKSAIVDRLSKAIIDNDKTLIENYHKEKSIQLLLKDNSDGQKMFKYGAMIEGLPFTRSIHAAGVIINDKPLFESLPILTIGDNNFTQYEMNYLEEQGFLKMDFLSIEYLNIISQSVDLINSRHPNVNLDKNNIPYLDDKIYEIINDLHTAAIFQIESVGMRKAIQKIKPKCFNDIVILISLFRPGPMDNIDNYVAKREHPQNIKYINDDIKKVLQDTYGILIYQEQINKLVTVMANFSLSEADMFRRAISKKDSHIIESRKKDFIEGSIKNGYSKQISEKMFDDIIKFANYGFNKSHAVVYAVLTCQMAYLKYYYPLEFYSCVLSSMDNPESTQFRQIVAEMKKRGFKINNPSINKSTKKYSIIDNKIYFPLSGISEVSSNIADKIIAERNSRGLFDGFVSFNVRMYHSNISEKAIINLINSGAFDEFSFSRKSLLKAVGPTMQYAELIGLNDSEPLYIDESMAPTISNNILDNEIEKLENEYKALKVFLNENILQYKIQQADIKDVTTLDDLSLSLTEKASLDKYYSPMKEYFVKGKIIVMIESVKIITSRKDQSHMAFLKPCDDSLNIDIVVFKDAFEKYKDILKDNNILIIDGRLQKRNGVLSFVADDIIELGGKK